MDIKLFDLAVAVVTNECRERDENISLLDMMVTKNACEKIDKIIDDGMIEADQVYIDCGHIYITAKLCSKSAPAFILNSDIPNICNRIRIGGKDCRYSNDVIFDVRELHFGK